MASTMPSSIYPVRFGAALAVALAVLLASPAAALSPVGQAQNMLRRLRQAVTPTPADQVMAFASAAAETSVTNAEALVAALQSGDLSASKAAYMKLRPEYEMIEHLYELFPNSDRDIDSRPDAHQYGEAYIKGLESTPGAIFKGSHRIEALLYRDGDVAGAVPWAQQLVADYRGLVSKLGADQAVRFTPPCIWHGLVEVATEVAKKKISGEEETWSDLSMMIFDTNLEGIDMMSQPWVESLKATNASVAEALSAAIANARSVLQPYIEAAPGGGKTYAPYSTVPVPTRRDIQLAFYGVADALMEAAEVLRISLDCQAPPEGETVPATATMEGGEAAEGEAEGRRRLFQEAEGEAEAEASGSGDATCTPYMTPKAYAGDSPEVLKGLAYFQALMPYQQAASAAFTAAVESGNLTAMRAVYAATRPLYEQIEVLAASFPNLDLALDAREYAFPEGERSPDFQGFHKLERLIFGGGDVGSQTLEVARGVEQTLSVLAVTLNTTAPDRFTSASNWEGMLNLAHEVAAKKVSSEEETFSDLSIMIYYNNWKGILSQAVPYCADAEQECEGFVAAIRNATACLGLADLEDDVLAVDASDVTDESIARLLEVDWGSYTAAPMELRRCVVERGYAVRDTLAAYASALNVLDDCSPWHLISHVPFPHRAEASV